MLGGIARGVGVRGELQSAADLSALAAARAMHDAYPRVFEPPVLDGVENPRHLERAEYLALRRARGAARPPRATARTTSASPSPAAGLAPIRVRVTVRDAIAVGAKAEVPNAATAEAELAPPGSDPAPARSRRASTRARSLAARASRCAPTSRWPSTAWRPPPARTASRCSSPRPSAATPSRRPCSPRTPIRSGWRRRAGRCTASAPSSTSGRPPRTAGWPPTPDASTSCSATRGSPGTTATRSNAGSSSLGFGRGRDDGASSGTLPSFVPARFAPAIARAAQRWSVSGALLAAQLYEESHFNPFARSAAGALGIAQFMPATAAGYGLADPFDADRAIDAQAHLMRDLLRTFASVPLALAAYNAGPDRVRACGCVPPIPETQSYVADILGLLHGAGDPSGDRVGGLEVRLVR